MSTKQKQASSRSVRRIVRQSWRDHPMMWVIGCIDSHGAITANPSKAGRCHTEEECRGKRFRWCVWSQELCCVLGGYDLTHEEEFAVWDWLRKRNYTDDRSMPNH